MREVQDHYFHLAKREGYVSRAAYKLREIDERKRVLKSGDCVLDCGAAPGSWMQVAVQRIGPRGCVVGVDLQPIKHQFNQPNVHSIQADLTVIEPQKLIDAADGLFDVILSDMAPNTTGDPFSDHYSSVRLCRSVLELCPKLLKRGGHLVMKVFEGEAYPELLKDCGGLFEVVKGFKPKASRSESTEMYIVAQGFNAGHGQSADGKQESAARQSRSSPPGGWGPRRG